MSTSPFTIVEKGKQYTTVHFSSYWAVCVPPKLNWPSLILTLSCTLSELSTKTQVNKF